MNRDFEPGTVITGKHVGTRWVVLDPVRTSRGKLRLRNRNGGVTTTWWVPGSLPPGYKAWPK